MNKPSILILGAGYGGILTALNLQKNLNTSEAEISLVNINDYHYFTTELHQPAAGTFPHEKTRVKINEILDFRKINFIQDEVVSVNTESRKVQLKNSEVGYDYLVIALGSEPETFGIKGLKENAFGKWTLNGARVLRQHIQMQFANFTQNPDKTELLTIVVGGAGFTGIEFVSEIAERVPQLCEEYDVPEELVRIVCVEAAPSALPGFDPALVSYAEDILLSKGVELLTNTPIQECTENGVLLANGERIDAATVVWAAGVRGNSIIENAGIENQRGRVPVNEYLQAPNLENVYVVGDCSFVINEVTGRPYPPTAQIAMQMGANLGNNLTAVIKESTNLKKFVPSIKGTVASLGRKDAIGVIGKAKVYGTTASLLKKIIDLRYLFIIGGLKLVLKKGRF